MAQSVMTRFLGFVEIKTKLASVLPFLLGLAYAAYAWHRLALTPTAVFFVSMLAFDMSVTGLNNYIDAKSDKNPLAFSRPASKQILAVLWMISGAGAAILVYHSGLVVFACGGLCVLVGILYTFGPAPISRMPLGEVFSGVFMGFFIPFLVVYINAPTRSLIWADFNDPLLQIGFNVRSLFSLAVLTVPAVLSIAGIMLANNICDVENDIKIKRFTLPYYIGSKNAVTLFALLYIAAYAAFIAMALFGVLPPYVLLVLPGFAAIWFNIRKFRRLQSKKTTFPLSIVNFLITMIPLILITAAAAVL